MGYTVHGILQARVGSCSLLPNSGIEPRSPALQAVSLPAEPQGKLKNTGVGSLSLLQQIFLIQESNQPINQGKLCMVKQEKARMNIDVLRISEQSRLGELNSYHHYINYCGEEPLKNEVDNI